VRALPILLLLPLGISLAASLFTVLFARSVASDIANALSLGPLGLVLAVAAPAVASGYNAVVGKAENEGRAGLRDFFGNLGAYYWRVVGGGLLAGLVVAPFAGFYATPEPAPAGVMWAATLAAVLIAAVSEVWFAAVVLDGVGVFEGVARSFGALFRSFADFAWPLGLLSLVSVLRSGSSAGLSGYIPGGPTPVPGALEVAASLAVALVGAVVRVAVFDAYARVSPAWARRGADAMPRGQRPPVDD
jgi:hypothetical protein